MAVARPTARCGAEAQRRHRLSAARVRMAHGLGVAPEGTRQDDNHRQERWKAPLPHFIEDLCARRFDRLGRPQIVTPEPPITSRRARRRLIEKADVLPHIRHGEPARGDARCTANR